MAGRPDQTKRLSLRKLSETAELAERAGATQAAGAMGTLIGPGGQGILDLSDKPFWVILTGHEFNDEEDESDDNGTNYCLYSWVEATSTLQQCGMLRKENGREGWVDYFPVMHPSGDSTLKAGDIAYVVLADSGDHYLIIGSHAAGTGSGGNCLNVSDLIQCDGDNLRDLCLQIDAPWQLVDNETGQVVAEG